MVLFLLARTHVLLACRQEDRHMLREYGVRLSARKARVAANTSKQTRP